MPVTCCVKGCKNRYKAHSGIHFYRIPKRPESRRSQWITAICGGERKTSVKLRQPSQCSRVCSQHFETGRPHDHEKHVDYKPTKNMGHLKKGWFVKDWRTKRLAVALRDLHMREERAKSQGAAMALLKLSSSVKEKEKASLSVCSTKMKVKQQQPSPSGPDANQVQFYDPFAALTGYGGRNRTEIITLEERDDIQALQDTTPSQIVQEVEKNRENELMLNNLQQEKTAQKDTMKKKNADIRSGNASYTCKADAVVQKSGKGKKAQSQSNVHFWANGILTAEPEAGLDKSNEARADKRKSSQADIEKRLENEILQRMKEARANEMLKKQVEEVRKLREVDQGMVRKLRADLVQTIRRKEEEARENEQLRKRVGDLVILSQGETQKIRDLREELAQHIHWKEEQVEANRLLKQQLEELRVEREEDKRKIKGLRDQLLVTSHSKDKQTKASHRYKQQFI